METANIIALLSIIVILIGFIVHNRFSFKHGKHHRFAEACKEFRDGALKSVSHIPRANMHWGNEILESMPSVVSELDLDVQKFKVFLINKERKQFKKEWSYLKKHIEKQIPKALSTAEIMYGGGTAMAKETKEKFHERLQKVLNYANET